MSQLKRRYAWLDDHKVFLCLIFIGFIALANLRGVRESGALFAAPTYAFLISFLFMIGYGRLAITPTAEPPRLQVLNKSRPPRATSFSR